MSHDRAEKRRSRKMAFGRNPILAPNSEEPDKPQKDLDIDSVEAYATNMCSSLVLTELAAEAAEATTPAALLLRLTALRQAVDAAMVAVLAELEAAPGPVLVDEAVDSGHWLAGRSELHPAEARALAGLARDLPAMPATSEALATGRVGTEKARILGTARDVAGFEDAEAGLVERVVGVSLRTARRIVGRFIADRRQSGPADPAVNEVTLAPRRDGRWRLHGDLDAETAAIIANELRRLAEGHRDAEGLSAARRFSLALLDLARRSVTLGEGGPGSRPDLVLVADVGLNGEIYDTRHEDGTPVSRKVFDTLTCDATIRGLVMHGPSEVLDLGRSQRLASAGQRRAAAVRDGGCVVPGCERSPDHCDLHHIRHWTRHRGPTTCPTFACSAAATTSWPTPSASPSSATATATSPSTAPTPRRSDGSVRKPPDRNCMPHIQVATCRRRLTRRLSTGGGVNILEA